MIKAIITFQNADGSYDSVGMNNRRIVDARTELAAERKAFAMAVGRAYRLEYHTAERFYHEPYRVRFVPRSPW